MGPFEHVKALSETKKYTLETEQDEKEYTPFIVNRAFSNFRDTVLYVNEINLLGGVLDKKLQYDFLFNAIPNKKRYSKWYKKKTNDDALVPILCEIYKYSQVKAEQVCSLLTKKQKEEIIKKFEKGGSETK